jgi:anti-anti-sigma regulatory factor
VTGNSPHPSVLDQLAGPAGTVGRRSCASALSLLESLVDENEFVVADFSEAAFVDSATMRVLLNADVAARMRGRRFRLQLGTAAIVRSAFELSGLLLRIECAHSRADALRPGILLPARESLRTMQLGFSARFGIWSGSKTGWHGAL